jgi:hypothetical protein
VIGRARRSRRAPAAAAASLALVVVVATGVAVASFTDRSSNPQTVSAVPDFLPPTASRSAIAKTQGGTAGYIKQGGTYYVYANVADAGNPASGISTVTADVSNVTTGQTAVALTSGSFSVGGLTYNYRSASLTANSTLSAGSKSYSLRMTDVAGNAQTQTGFSVTVENGGFTGSDWLSVNKTGGVNGKAEQGDTVTFVYNKAPEPDSVLSGWTGGNQSVTVKLVDSNNVETLTVLSGSSTLPLGSVNTNGDYVSKNNTVNFTSSTMSLSGNNVSITLGTPDVTSSLKTDNNNNTPVWSPNASVYDRADNPVSTTNVSQGLPARKQF